MATVLPPFNLDGFAAGNSAEVAAIKRIVDYIRSVDPDGGGISVYGDLGDAASANLPVTNTPLANALGAIVNLIDTKQPTLVQGTGISIVGTTISAAGGAPESIVYSLTIPLDLPGNGKIMPQTSFTTNGATFLIGSGPTEDGNCRVCLVGDGTAIPNLSHFSLLGDPTTNVYNKTAGARNLLIFTYLFGEPCVYITQLSAIDITDPLGVSVTVQNSTPTVATVLFDSDMDQTQNPANFYLGFSTTGHTWNSSVWGDTARKLVLTTATPFVNGEGAKTLSFIQTGSINLQDLAGNKLATIASPIAITNNVNPLPTIVSVAVGSGTLNKFNVTLSEAYTGSLPAASAFAIAGGTHAITGIAAGAGAGIFDLTTSTPVAYGEVLTLSYTKPGSNPITGASSGQQLASVSGVTISNGAIAPTGSIVITDVTPVDEDMRNYDAFVVNNGGSEYDNFNGYISGPTYSNGLAKETWNAGAGPVLTVDDTHGVFFHTGFGAGGNTAGKVTRTVPAGLSAHRVRIWFGEAARLRVSLSDASFAEQTVVIASGVRGCKDVVFNAGSNGQTLLVGLECAGADYFGHEAIAFKLVP